MAARGSRGVGTARGTKRRGACRTTGRSRCCWRRRCRRRSSSSTGICACSAPTSHRRCAPPTPFPPCKYAPVAGLPVELPCRCRRRRTGDGSRRHDRSRQAPVTLHDGKHSWHDNVSTTLGRTQSDNGALFGVSQGRFRSGCKRHSLAAAVAAAAAHGQRQRRPSSTPRVSLRRTAWRRGRSLGRAGRGR